MKTNRTLHPLRRASIVFAAMFVLVLGFAAPPASAALEQYNWQQLTPTTNAAASDSSGMSADGMVLYVPVDNENTVFYSADGGLTWLSRPYPAAPMNNIAVSADGTKVVGLSSGNVFISTDSSQTWSAAIPVGCATRWIDISDDGTRLIIGCSSGYLYTSVNGGLNWTQRTGAGSRSWQGVAISADGVTMTAAYSNTGSSTTGYVYTSVDGGVTWTQRVSAGVRYWKSIDMSADGATLFATAAQTTVYEAPQDIFRSSDGGASWTQQSGLGQIIDSGTGVVVSRDGQTVVVTDRPTDNPTIKISSDGGAAWAHTQEFDSYYYSQPLSVSGNGQTILMPSLQGPVVLTRDQGATWEMVSGIRSADVGWTDVATTLDGQKVWLGNWWPSGPIQYSSDSGASWSGLNSMGSHDWDGIAVSADGTYVTATGGCSWAETYLHVSSDGGATWQQKMTDQPRSWDQLAMSTDGRVQIATECGGYIYSSSDYGQTWTTHFTDATRSWTDVAVSADGTRLVATVYNGGVYISNDSGATWAQSMGAGTHRFYRAVMSADGEKIVIATYNGAVGEGLLYVSNDGGGTWQSIDTLTPLGWQSLAMSADGSHIAASSEADAVNPGIYISTDGGATWALQTTPQMALYELAMSGDGSVIYAVNSWGDLVYRGEKQAPLVPMITFARALRMGAMTIDGAATPGVDVVATFPLGQQAEDDTDVFGSYSVPIPGDVRLAVGDIVTIQERSAAGVLGTPMSVTVLSVTDGTTLASTGMNGTAIGYWAIGLIVAGAAISAVRRQRRVSRR